MTRGYNRLQGTGADVTGLPTLFQLKILKHKADGRTDRAVAQALDVGERTIRRHIDSLISSLAVSNRAALFVEVGRRGWLDFIPDDDGRSILDAHT